MTTPTMTETESFVPIKLARQKEVDTIGCEKMTVQSWSRNRLSEEKSAMKIFADHAGLRIRATGLVSGWALGLWLFAIMPVAAEEPRPAQAGNSQLNCVTPASPVAPRGSAGMRAFVDPQTGELTGPPTGRPPEVAPPPQAPLSTSDEGLAEVDVPRPGRGVMVDLRGRFRSALTATVGPDGKVRLQHQRPCPDGTQPKR